MSDRKTKVQGYTRKMAERNRVIIRTAKDVPCMDCGVKYPYYVMDFDHRGGKLFNIGRLVHSREATLIAEIAKCDVVCANCHRQRSFGGI